MIRAELLDVRKGAVNGVRGTMLEWRATGGSAWGVQERMKERMAVMFPMTILGMDTVNVDVRTEPSLTSFGTYDVTIFVPDPGRGRINIGGRFADILEVLRQEGFM